MPPVVIALPKHCSVAGLIRELAERGALREDVRSDVVIRIPPEALVETPAVAFLASWGLLQKKLGRVVKIVGPGGTAEYLARMDLFHHLDVPFRNKERRHPDVGWFLPLRLITDDASLGIAVSAVCDLVLHQLENGRELVPALEWSANEIAGNILDHSESPVPGAICAQYFPELRRLEIGICDMGLGLKATVSQAFPVWSYGDAITKALERGFTRSREVGAGNGLAGSVELVKLNGGGFDIWSGDACYGIEDGSPVGFRVFAGTVPGTGVGLRLDTSRPVDPGLTFLGKSDWTYLDSECQRVSKQGGLRVANECVHFGSRQPARALRVKVENLLPSMEGPLTLDFGGVDRAASSFLDELLGRLAERLGAVGFRERILVAGANHALLDMANMVIGERLRAKSA